ncbi:MAG: alkaline phosphatase D family protein [Saprospiraceae bacterium]|nr:alkaline phosphatase D family protein [Saprospiraceae bacterium]
MDDERIKYLLKNNHRRDFIRTGLFSLAAWPLLINRPLQALVRRSVPVSDYPFQLGIASGDPWSDGFVIWTRLATNPLEDGGMPAVNVAVEWTVSRDEKMSQAVAKGIAIAAPEMAHSIHVEVSGLLPDHWYFYQFKAGNEVSAIGRARTAPSENVMSDQFRFAFASCQHYEYGYFTAYEHMLNEPLDLVVHLGDYIYEYGGREDRVRKHLGSEIQSLEDYRRRISQYKLDPSLQAVHAAFPWILTWDDHEFDNNYANAISEEADISKEDFLKRRANAYQAYYEHMPLRKSTIPKGPDMKLYRNINFGRLLEFNVLDTRQYRTDQPCGDKNGPLCEEVFDPKASMMGIKQEKWLGKQLRKSNARWNVLAQQVMMAGVDRDTGESKAYSMDQWPGYDVSRRRLMDLLGQPHIENPIVLTGDIHSNWVNDLKEDYDRPELKTVATEFVGTSITSGGDGKSVVPDLDGLLRDNPFLKFHSQERGYVKCEVSPSAWKSDYQAVEYVSKPGSPLITRGSFVVENGKEGLKKLPD